MAKPKSFFMFCLGDFATKLSIPAAYVEDHRLHHHRQLFLHLKTQPAATSWAVKIKKINGVFYIADGWSKFVKDNNILERKILIFHIVGDSALHVSIFGHDSCMELPPSSSGTCPARKSRFVKKVKEYHIFGDQRMEIPKDFSDATEIGRKGEICLKDWNGRKWPVTITDQSAGIYTFSGGWTKFLKGNNLQGGAILLFDFDMDSDDVIKVVLLEDQVGEKMLLRANYGGFMPS